MKKKLSGYIYRKTTAIVILILLQLVFLMVSLLRMANIFPYIYGVLLLLSIAMLVTVINSDRNPAYKLAWVIPILMLPLFGGIFYLLFGSSKVSSRLKKNREIQQKFKQEYLSQDPIVKEQSQAYDASFAPLMNYVSGENYPVYANEGCEYFPLGEDKFRRMKEELLLAKEYIFLEYFIIAEGKMWDEILVILKQKVQEGVEVRVLFDDCGSWGLLPRHHEKALQEAGILCRVFNPLRPSLTITMNNRDHRKILIIDGKVGFTGGINIGDEYINHIEVHGHWKDTAVMIRGQAVNTLISLFFEMWNLVEPEDEDVSGYYKCHTASSDCDGFLQPYGSDPFSDEPIGEYIYLDLIHKAQKEILIATPYLIIDNELTTALCLAAKSGVSVTILTPHIADKWYVHLMTVASYPQLMKAGVNILEYTPGFVHAKMFIVDGKVATVGTVNLDYRSLYLHFECGVILYGSKAVEEIRNDYQKTITLSQKILPEDMKKIRWYHRIFQRLVQALSPLM